MLCYRGVCVEGSLPVVLQALQSVQVLILLAAGQCVGIYTQHIQASLSASGSTFIVPGIIEVLEEELTKNNFKKYSGYQ